METVDDIVRMSIEDVFPDQTIPDHENYLPNGNQFKAPDHAILDGKVLIERKSRNTVDQSQFYYKLTEIAQSQGKPFYGYGKLNLGKIIETLPDPDDATRKMVDFSMNQMMKAVREAMRKFEEYSKHVKDIGQLRILAISDNTQILGANDTEEYFFGRKMGGLDHCKDETGPIDSIIFVKHPRYVFDQPNSYWFKCLIKRRLSSEDSDIVNRVSAALHNRIARHASFFPEVDKIKAGRFRPLIA